MATPTGKSPIDKYGEAMRKAGNDIGANMGTRPIGGPGDTIKNPVKRKPVKKPAGMGKVPGRLSRPDFSSQLATQKMRTQTPQAGVYEGSPTVNARKLAAKGDLMKRKNG